MALALVAAGGCSRQPTPTTSALPSSGPGVILSGRVDSFGLPLNITLNAPEVPKEISRPSPPIPDEVKGSGGVKK